MSESNSVNLINHVTKFCQLVLSEQYFKILKYRYGLDGIKLWTLQKTGNAVNLSRERIRQIQAESIKTIRLELLESGSNHELSGEAKGLRDNLVSLGYVVTFFEIAEFLCEKYEFDLAENANTVRFLLEVFGFNKIALKKTNAKFPMYSGSDLEAWELRAKLVSEKLLNAVELSDFVLREANRFVGFDSLQLEVNQRTEAYIDPETLKYALQISPDIEIQDERYRIEFGQLKTQAKQAYRVLFANEQPLHHRDILRRINNKRANADLPTLRNHHSLVNQMSRSDDFVSIGKSGRWGLANWSDISSQYTVDIIIEFFHKVDKSASLDEIHSYVIERRPYVSKNSIAAYLYEKPQFHKVSEHDYELVAWGNQTFQPTYRHGEKQQQLVEMTRAYFRVHENDIVLQSVLANHLKNVTDFRKDVIYNWIKHTSYLVSSDHPELKRRKMVEFIESPDIPVRKTLREQVTESVIDYLSIRPDHRAAVRDVKKFVLEKVNCAPHTFYSYLDKIEQVAKETGDGILYCKLTQPTNNQLSLYSSQAIQKHIFANTYVLQWCADNNEGEAELNQGTCFHLSGVGLVTCAHVLPLNDEETYIFSKDQFWNKFPVKCVWKHSLEDGYDLAIIEAEGLELREGLTRGEVEEEKRGMSIYLAGFPSYSNRDSGQFRHAKIVGWRDIRIPKDGKIARGFMIDTAIISGNSGGPVTDLQGRVIGIAQRGIAHPKEQDPDKDTEKHIVMPIHYLFKAFES